MRIYITDLAAYNQGHLIGEWITLPMSEEELNSKIEAILNKGAVVCEEQEHEEIFITDYECDYISINEYDNIHKLNEIAEQTDSLNEYDIKAIGFLMENNLVNSFEDAMERYEDVRVHEDSTLEDVAYDYVNECYNLEDMPSIIVNNIDYEKIARELEIEGNYYVVGSDVFEYLE